MRVTSRDLKGHGHAIKTPASTITYFYEQRDGELLPHHTAGIFRAVGGHEHDRGIGRHQRHWFKRVLSNGDVDVGEEDL